MYVKRMAAIASKKIMESVVIELLKIAWMKQNCFGKGPKEYRKMSGSWTVIPYSIAVQQDDTTSMLIRVLFLSDPNLSNQIMPKISGIRIVIVTNDITMAEILYTLFSLRMSK